MRPLEEPYCQRCGDAYESEDGVFLCSNCGDRKFHFAFAFAPFRAEGPLLQLIHRFKYSRELHLSVPLARMIAMGAHEPRVGVFLEENPWVVPVPLHPRREREREYNQAAELGRAFAGQAGLDFAPVLARRRYTVTQTRLGRKERMGNLRDAFSFQPPRRLRAGWPGGRPVLLVDDVLTTGSTASACAKILKASGAPGVVVLTLARG
jgi:ComF family protein